MNPLDPTSNSSASASAKLKDVLSDLQQKVSDLIAQTPAKDIEKNVRALLMQGFNKLDLVTREEFDLQEQLLVKTRARLEALEKRVEALENRSVE